ncbi:MAG: histidinol-phosphate transaminase [Candidatus Epulonipiscioides saccharophilum]|nr:MAG: histidinol-phosphate transaminase [Epulopiscium sp. AS2M-Bin001]
MSKFLNNNLSNLVAYTPGEQPKKGEYIKLNTNESPYPPPPEVLAIVNETARYLNLYCDPSARLLIETFCDYYHLLPSEVIFGNGSDEILAFCYLAFCQDAVAFPEISYGFYQVFADLFNISADRIPLNDNFEIVPHTYFNKKKTIIIANPNAPTGIALSLADIERIAIENPSNVVIIDEAYCDFSNLGSARALIHQYDNIIVVGTFSKSRNLAGARLGYAVASKDLIADLNLVKNSYNPYNVNSMTQAIGVESIKADSYFKSCVQNIIDSRKDFVAFLNKQNFFTLPSQANFILTKSYNMSGQKFYEYLRSQKILVRYFDYLPEFVRITVSSKQDMEILKNVILNLK